MHQRVVDTDVDAHVQRSAGEKQHVGHAHASARAQQEARMNHHRAHTGAHQQRTRSKSRGKTSVSKHASPESPRRARPSARGQRDGDTNNVTTASAGDATALKNRSSHGMASAPQMRRSATMDRIADAKNDKKMSESESQNNNNHSDSAHSRNTDLRGGQMSRQNSMISREMMSRKESFRKLKNAQSIEDDGVMSHAHLDPSSAPAEGVNVCHTDHHDTDHHVSYQEREREKNEKNAKKQIFVG